MSRETDILRAVLAEINGREVKPPAGFLRIKEWQSKWKKSRRVTRQCMKVAIEKGLLVKQNYRINVRGYMSLVPFYGPPPKKEKR